MRMATATRSIWPRRRLDRADRSIVGRHATCAIWPIHPLLLTTVDWPTARRLSCVVVVVVAAAVEWLSAAPRLGRIGKLNFVGSERPN